MGAATTPASSGVNSVGPISGAAVVVVEVVGAEGVSVDDVQDTSTAMSATNANQVRPRMRLRLGFGFVSRLRIGAELRRLLGVIADGVVGIDVLLGAEHEE